MIMLPEQAPGLNHEAISLNDDQKTENCKQKTSSRLFFFGAADIVAQFGRQFVVFIIDGFFQCAAETDQLGAFFAARSRTPRMLAGVRQLAVDVHYKRFELGFETDVIVRAPQASLTAEFVKGYAANRTRLLIQPRQFLGGLAHDHLVRQHGGHAAGSRRLAGRGGQILPGVIFAKMQFLRFSARQFRDVECRRLVALLAFHCCVRYL